MKRARLRLFSLSCAGLAIIGSAAQASIVLTSLGTDFGNGIIGIDHHPFSNKVIVSSNYNVGGTPYNFELIDALGAHAQFSTVSGLTDEIKIATAKAGSSFPVGTTFAGNGVDGEIIKISPDGTVVTNPWVNLGPGTGLMRGSLHVDSTGVWGGDLLVVTTSGYIYRVNAAGVATLVTSNWVGLHLEGLVAVPNDPKYGPWAGRMLVGAEGYGVTFAVAPDGSSDYYFLGINPEDFDMIPANQNFFGVAFADNAIVAAGPAQFTGIVGDILVTQESPGKLFSVRWNSVTATFDVTEQAEVTQFEHVTFSTAGIAEIPPTVPCRSQGYWKTHPEAWPVDSLTLGDEVYTKTQLLALMNKSATKDASLILAYQLIAAKLNQANGSDVAQVQTAIDAADALLAPYSGKLPYGVKPSSAAGQQMVAVAAVLEAYNLTGA